MYSQLITSVTIKIDNSIVPGLAITFAPNCYAFYLHEKLVNSGS